MRRLESEFYEMLKKYHPKRSRHHFENQWAYILQATRNGLYVYRLDNSIVYYTKRNSRSEKSPTVIVNAFGPLRHELIVSIAEREHAKGCPVIVKNIPKRERKLWHALGFVETSKNWSLYSHRDDNSFPQYYHNPETIRSRSYSKSYRKMIRQLEQKQPVTTSLYDSANDSQARTLLEAFATHAQQRGIEYKREVVRSHLFFFDNDITNLVRVQHTSENGTLLGFSAFVLVDTTAFFTMIINKVENNLNKYLAHEALAWLIKTYPYITCCVDQGSETRGQDFIKQQLKPTVTISKTHMRFQGEQKPRIRIDSIS